MHISFQHDNCQLIYPNGAVFNITQRRCLYYLKNIVSAKNATHDLHTWHKILGHGNKSDITKLPNLVKRMKRKPTPNCVLTVIYVFKGRCRMTEIKLWIARQKKSLHLYTVI